MTKQTETEGGVVFVNNGGCYSPLGKSNGRLYLNARTELHLGLDAKIPQEWQLISGLANIESNSF